MHRIGNGRRIKVMGEGLEEPKTSCFCVVSISCTCVESRSGAGRRRWGDRGVAKSRLGLTQDQRGVPHSKVCSLSKTPGLGFPVS